MHPPRSTAAKRPLPGVSLDDGNGAIPRPTYAPAFRPGHSRRHLLMAEIALRDASRQAIREAMIADERVIMMGEDIGAYGGSYSVSRGLLDEFGPQRIIDTP